MKNKERTNQKRPATKDESQRRVKTYAKKGIMFLIWPIIWPFHQVKQSKKNYKQATSNIKDQVHTLKKNRDPWAKNAPDMSNFEQVLNHWDVQEEDIETLIGGLKAQMLLFSCLGLWGVWLLTGSLYSILHGIPLAFLGSAIFITRLWRVQVLQRRRFVFFKDWFLWGTFAWVGTESPIAFEKRLKQEGRNE